jgi:hypothetical protein
VAAKTDNPVLIGAPDGRIEWANEAFCRVMEYSLEEVVGKNPMHFMVGPETNPRTIARIRSGDIAVRKGVESFARSEVRFADGTREQFDAVVLATGFTTGLATMLAEHTSVLDQHGRPLQCGRETTVPGLYFCGYGVASTGLLRQIGIEARAIGASIARDEEMSSSDAMEDTAAMVS